MERLIAFDIGGTTIAWAIVALESTQPVIQHSGEMPTQADRGGVDVARRVISQTRELYATHPDAVGIAVAAAGVVDPATGSITSATNTMPGWAGIELGELLSEASNLPVRVLNDVHAHGLGEALHGAGRGAASVLAVAVGTGIGGALIHDGDVRLGERHLAGHVGHIHHHYAAGMPCSCGRRGHIEAICSGSGITEWYNQRARAHGDTNQPVKNGKELQDLADGGHELAQQVFVESAFALGEALGSLANCVDPSVVVLSGSMTKSGPRWWDSLHRGYAASAMDPVAELPLVSGELGGNAPLIGAARNFLTATRGKPANTMHEKDRA